MVLHGLEAIKFIQDKSKFFTPAELVCKCGCGTIAIDPEMLRVINFVRHIVGSPLKITSGTRCMKHNEAEGGKKDSEHLDGQGADIETPSSRLKYAVIMAASAIGVQRIGIGSQFVHLGVSPDLPQKVLWTY